MDAVTIKEPKQRKHNGFLYFTAVTANLATMASLGGSFIWSSPAIPRLNGQIDPENNPLPHPITTIEESWIASLLPLGAAISTFVAGYSSDKIGRKYTLLASSIPTIAGFLSLTFSTTVVGFYLGRFLCGLGVGIVSSTIPTYIGEISENTNRGALGCLFLFFITVGNLITYVLTPLVSLKVLTAVNLIAPVAFLIIFGVFAAESPYYYVAKNRLNLAEKSLLKLRYNDHEITEKELPVIIKNVKESYAKRVGFDSILKDKVVLKAFSVSIGLSIFEETNSGIPSDYCAIIAGIVQLVASACAIPLVDKYGRKILLISSAAGDAVTAFSTGVYFYLKENTSVDVSVVNWLPVLMLNLFTLSYSMGFGPVTFAMIGELFPPHIRSMASTISIFFYLFSMFCTTNVFPYLRDFMGMGLSFCFLGFISFLAAIFVYVRVPETKGKSLQDIQELLR